MSFSREQTSTFLSLTVILCGVEGCLHLTFIDDFDKLSH